MGWRYLLFAMGGLTLAMFVLRFFVFTMYESPKFLMGRGDDAGAARVVGEIARCNGVESSFALDHLKQLDETGEERARTSAAEAVRRKMRVFNFAHIAALFRTRALARSTATIIVLWFLIVCRRLLGDVLTMLIAAIGSRISALQRIPPVYACQKGYG